MVNDLGGSSNIVKFVDVSTTWEVIARNSPSQLPSTVADCENWASDNNMKLNPPKTKNEELASRLSLSPFLRLFSTAKRLTLSHIPTVAHKCTPNSKAHSKF